MWWQVQWVSLVTPILAALAACWMSRPAIHTAAAELTTSGAWQPSMAVAWVVLLAAWLSHRAWGQRGLWLMLCGVVGLSGAASWRTSHASADYASSLDVFAVVPAHAGEPIGALANPHRWNMLPTEVYQTRLPGGMLLRQHCYAGKCDVRLLDERQNASELRGDSLQQYWFDPGIEITVSVDRARHLWVVRGGDAVVAFEHRGTAFVPRSVGMDEVASALGPPPWMVALAWLGAVGGALLLLRTRRDHRLLTRAGELVEATLDDRGWLVFADARPPERYQGALSPGLVVVARCDREEPTIYRGHGRLDESTVFAGSLSEWTTQMRRRRHALEMGTLTWMLVGSAPLIGAASIGFV